MRDTWKTILDGAGMLHPIPFFDDGLGSPVFHHQLFHPIQCLLLRNRYVECFSCWKPMQRDVVYVCCAIEGKIPQQTVKKGSSFASDSFL